MTDVAARLRAFLSEAPHWIDLLATEPARHVLRHDTIHPVFHGCIDWHSACHGVWALIAHERATGDKRHVHIVDALLMPEKLAREAADLAARPDFEMPYGRAWLLRLALEDRLATGSTRLTFIARDVAASLVDHYRAHPPEPFSREYANPSWALANLFDYATVENRADLLRFTRETARGLAASLDGLPSPDEEGSWPDFMAVVPNLCDLLARTEAVTPEAIAKRVGARLEALRPIREPTRAHHYALNFSRAWSLLALGEACRNERLIEVALDHLETGLTHPSWWRGDYRAVSHWVPQFGIFALQRAIEIGRRVTVSLGE
jgi:hypothetical protein